MILFPQNVSQGQPLFPSVPESMGPYPTHGLGPSNISSNVLHSNINPNVLHSNYGIISPPNTGQLHFSPTINFDQGLLSTNQGGHSYPGINGLPPQIPLPPQYPIYGNDFYSNNFIPNQPYYNPPNTTSINNNTMVEPVQKPIKKAKLSKSVPKKSNPKRGVSFPKHQGTTLPSFKPPQKPKGKSKKPLIILDTSNICYYHGKTKYFSLQGFLVVCNYFLQLGHDVKGFIAAYMLQPIRHINPDTVENLKKLVNDGILITTPSKDYDDSYMIQYARSHSGYIVTNDMFRDYINKAENKEEATKWVREHTISFTFVGDEFLPNPESHYSKNVVNKM